MWGVIGLLLLFHASCSDDMVSNKYCNLPARFSFSPVNSKPNLNTSCNSPGEWCTITLSNGRFYFTKVKGDPDKYDPTAQDGYTGFYMGLSGFIVGLPNIPEVGETYSVVTCYDLACRNCYEDYGVARKMELREMGYAYCSRCRRTYNLNNTGQVSDGDAGKPLYRYRVNYMGNILSINNP